MFLFILFSFVTTGSNFIFKITTKPIYCSLLFFSKCSKRYLFCKKNKECNIEGTKLELINQQQHHQLFSLLCDSQNNTVPLSLDPYNFENKVSSIPKKCLIFELAKAIYFVVCTQLLMKMHSSLMIHPTGHKCSWVLGKVLIWSDNLLCTQTGVEMTRITHSCDLHIDSIEKPE